MGRSHPVRCAVAALVVAALAVPLAGAQRPAEPGRARLFPPIDLGLLEPPDRDVWQQPDRIMDALG
ncbi:MAG: hypothetical protein AB7P67_12110, partial [Vicinamibacterales bacterium]